MLQDEIRQRLGINKSSNQNDFMLWMDCYHGEYPWLGGDNLESLGLAASISSEFARLATIELESEIGFHQILRRDEADKFIAFRKKQGRLALGKEGVQGLSYA